MSDNQKSRPGGQALTRETVVELAGDIDNGKISAILAAEATIEDLEEAIAWAAGESDVMGEERLALSGVAALLYDILTADEIDDDERR